MRIIFTIIITIIITYIIIIIFLIALGTRFPRAEKLSKLCKNKLNSMVCFSVLR